MHVRDLLWNNTYLHLIQGASEIMNTKLLEVWTLAKFAKLASLTLPTRQQGYV